MWAAITASVFIALALCNAEEKLKWSKPDSEQTNSDWVPLSADQLGQASARSLGPPPQQNHLIHGIFQQDGGNGFQQPFQQQTHFRPNEHQQNNFRPNEHQQNNFRPNDHQQNKFLHPQVLSQQFLPPPPPPQIPQHLLSQQLPPQFLNQQFESTFNQFSPGSPLLGPQFAPPKDQFVHSPVRPEPPRQHFNDFLTEQKLPAGNLEFPSQNPQINTFSGPVTDDEATPKPSFKGNGQEEKEQVQILYVPVETLKQRGKEASKGNQPIPQTITQPAPQVTPTQSVPQAEIQKETKKFRHPIQPLKEQAPAREYSNFDINSFAPQKTKPEKTQYFQEEFDSVKDTTSQHVTTSQFQDGQETKFFKPAQQDYDVQYPTREPSFGQTDFKQFQNEKEFYTERPAPEFNNYNRFSEIPSRSPLNNERQHQSEVFHETSTTKLPPPNQPPLSVYMETSPNSKVGDVLSLLKDAKTIPVLDTIGPDSPQVFVGPSNLKPPHGYVKFELPYLSSLDGNRVEKKVLQLPFFVAPLNFQPPPGFSKIPFPPPHIGSVVLSNNTAKSVTEKYATTPVPHLSYSTTFRDPYTIPADISSISPQLPSLINSLQEEEQYGPTTIYSTSPAEPVTDAPVETVPPTTTTKRPLNSRRNNFRGSQRNQYTSTTPSSDSKRQRQRRPIQSRTQSRFHVATTPSTTTTTTESYVSSTISQSYSDKQYEDQQRSKDDSSSVANQQQNVYEQENNERQFEDGSKNKNLDVNYQSQDFIPQYTPSYYQSDNKGEKTISPSHHATEFTSVTKDSFDTSLTDSFRPQSQPESGQTYFSSFDSQFPASSINYEDNRQTFKEQVKDKSRNVIETTTETFFGRPQYRPTADEAPFAYEESPVPIGQLPPAETVHDFAPKHKVHHSNVPQFVQTLEGGSTPNKQDSFISDSHKQQDSFIRDSPKQQDSFVRDSPKQQDSFIRDFSPDYNSEYTTQQNYQRPSQSDFKDYPSPILNRHNIPTTDSPVVEKETYRPTSYSTEEDVRVTQKTKHRGRHEHKSHDEYRTKTTTESYVETTTSDRPVTRTRGRIRGRPLTSRPKTTTEPPNYPSNFGLVSQQTTEAYQEEKKVSTESYISVTEPVYTTQPTSEATTKNARRKFSNTRTVHRRPVRPTSSSAVPSETTTFSPSGTKYLIRTRRPASAPQVTKLSTGRSRIRRPTTPASTTTEAIETEKWTVPQLPGLVYNQGESNSRSSVGVTKFETYQTTPSSRFEERPKSSDSFYQSRDDEPVTRRHRPTHTTFDDYQPDEVVTVRGKIHKVTARPHRPNLEAESEHDSNQSLEKRFKHRDETRVSFKGRGKHRGTQQPQHQDENEESNSQESQEAYRRPSLRHKESHSTPAYYESSDEKVVYRSDDHKQAQATTPSSAVYRQRESESSEEKYSSERGVTEKPRVAQQKDGDDFWNQGVTIQQSKSFDYSPEEEQPRKTKSKPKSAPQFNEYDDYFGFQDQEKHATSDQSPFPSNDQQVTYTGLKPDIDVGKASQYPEKEKDKEIENIKYVENEASTEVIKQETPSTESTPFESSSEAEEPKTKKPGRKRGMWVRVRVKKPKDVFETAESQRFGSLNLLTNAKDKTDEKWTKEKETVADTTQSVHNSSSPSLMEQFQNTLKNMMTSYMNGETTPKDAEKTTAPPAEIAPTTAIYEPTTPQIQTTEDDSITTIQPSTNDEITTTLAPVTSAYSEETVDPKVLGTSTTTEISLETEICYKGRCVKTKRSKDKVKDESDLMTVE